MARHPSGVPMACLVVRFLTMRIAGTMPHGDTDLFFTAVIKPGYSDTRNCLLSNQPDRRFSSGRNLSWLKPLSILKNCVNLLAA